MCWQRCLLAFTAVAVCGNICEIFNMSLDFCFCFKFLSFAINWLQVLLNHPHVVRLNREEVTWFPRKGCTGGGQRQPGEERPAGNGSSVAAQKPGCAVQSRRRRARVKPLEIAEADRGGWRREEVARNDEDAVVFQVETESETEKADGFYVNGSFGIGERRVFLCFFPVKILVAVKSFALSTGLSNGFEGVSGNGGIRQKFWRLWGEKVKLVNPPHFHKNRDGRKIKFSFCRLHLEGSHLKVIGHPSAISLLGRVGEGSCVQSFRDSDPLCWTYVCVFWCNSELFF